ncbi:hypothetical protein DPEC_G00186040 [Dallia pectoralis]|uniref:Uncharacterized protein n=1 Tax=Dallia pectoralis TaxID=75939 RepID=A0ACC2GBE6_DALPE|nr:hypothetical protein DPEC_G00186040 [Dallia pectoralis]
MGRVKLRWNSMTLMRVMNTQMKMSINKWTKKTNYLDCPADNYMDIEPKTNKHTMPRDSYRWLKKDLISPNTIKDTPTRNSASVMFAFQRTRTVFGTFTTNENQP